MNELLYADNAPAQMQQNKCVKTKKKTQKGKYKNNNKTHTLP